MINELLDAVWRSPSLPVALRTLEGQWLKVVTGIPGDDELESKISLELACRYMEASAILSCSNNPQQRLVAYRMATYTYDLFHKKIDNLSVALRVVLTRLGNFPGLQTAAEVEAALAATPWVLAGEEFARVSANSVVVAGRDVAFTDYQKLIWGSLLTRKSVAISAPTSAGKSFLLQLFVIEMLSRSELFASCYIVPTRALITQVSEDLALQFSKYAIDGVEIITVPPEADEPLPKSSVFVLTQERLQILLMNHPDKHFDFLVVDEAHSVRDGDRGIILQSVIDEVIRRNGDIQLLFASPTVSNLEIFAEMTGIKSLVESRSSDVTVSQNFINVEVESSRRGVIQLSAQEGEMATPVGKITIGEALNSRVECLVHVSHKLGASKQSIVYADGQADAEKIAHQISDLRFSEESSAGEELRALAALAKEAVHPKYVMALTVLRGVGFHYGNIPTVLRNAVEKAFSSGHLHYLVCTSTLLSGVNMPARNMFMCHPIRSKGVPLESVDFWNLSGRAGRLKREFQGNIFLIDYDKWRSRALSGPKAAVLTPAIQSVLSDRADDIEAVINGDAFLASKTSDAGLETIALRLVTDHKFERVGATFDRAGLKAGSDVRARLELALRKSDEFISLPAEVLEVSPTVSPHRQQRLYSAMLHEIRVNGLSGAKGLLVKHPREAEAFASYVAVLRRCHGVLMERVGSERQNRYFALMILKWMQGTSISELVDGRQEFNRAESINTSIRSTLDLVEKELRFNYVRVFNCYGSLLSAAYQATENEELIKSIPSIPLYLEVGASDKTMISFISMGLSRLAAKKLTDACPNKSLDMTETRKWLERQDLEILGFSKYLRDEVVSITSRSVG